MEVSVGDGGETITRNDTVNGGAVLSGADIVNRDAADDDSVFEGVEATLPTEQQSLTSSAEEMREIAYVEEGSANNGAVPPSNADTGSLLIQENGQEAGLGGFSEVGDGMTGSRWSLNSSPDEGSIVASSAFKTRFGSFREAGWFSHFSCFLNSPFQFRFLFLYILVLNFKFHVIQWYSATLFLNVAKLTIRLTIW